MNTDQNYTEIKPYLRVLDKYINFFIFGSIEYPDFPSSEILPIDFRLIKMLKTAESLDSEESDDLMQNYIEEFYINFKEELSDQDLLNLMHCYGNSNFRLHIQIKFLLNNENKQIKPSDLNSDTQILNDLLWNLDHFPDEILSYMYLHFNDIIMHIDIQSKVINQIEYENIIDKYRIDCSYEDILQKLHVEND